MDCDYGLKTPLVSIIITTYNRSEYLSAAIESALNQTYSNIEVIVVDDNNKGSDEAEFVENLVSSYPGVKYLSTIKNSGACVARNLGAQNARGKFINFLDDDDLLLNSKIEKQIQKMNDLKELHDNLPAAIGGFEEFIDSGGRIIGKRENRLKGNVFFENLCQSICQTSVPIIDRNTFLQAGGFGEIPSCQEHYMFARLFSINPYYDYIDESVVQIRHYDGPRISNGDKKIKGSKLLFEHFKNEYFGDLSFEEQKRVSCSMRENVISAFLLFNDRKGALEFYLKNRNVFYSMTKNITTLLQILLPKKAFSILYKLFRKSTD